MILRSRLSTELTGAEASTMLEVWRNRLTFGQSFE
jgi:hypothetical protein